MIVTNDITASDAGFGIETNQVTPVQWRADVEPLELKSNRGRGDCGAGCRLADSRGG
jgi:hypothetical protein